MTLNDRVAVLGGADPTDPHEPANRLRHVFVGWLIIAIATWAFLSATEAFHGLLPLGLAAVAGLLIGMVIFSVDALITVTFLKADTGFHRARIVFLRGMISLAMGLVIAQSTIIYMYAGSLAQIVAAHDQALAAVDQHRITAQSQWPGVITRDTDKITADKNQITAAGTAITEAQDRLNQLSTEWLNDEVCVNGGTTAADGNRCGPGPVTGQLKQELGTFQNATLPGIERTQNATITAARGETTRLNQEISAANKSLAAQINAGTKADLADNDLAARGDALLTLLSHSKLAWVWPAFFVTIDLAVALMKGILPESEFDRRRREERRHAETVSAMVAESPVWREVANHEARRLADAAMARADAQADQKIAAARARSGASSDSPARTLRQVRRLPRKWRLAGTSAAVTLAMSLTITVGSPGGDSTPARPAALSARGGQSITLAHGEKLTIPAGAITGNATVTASYTAAHAWAGNSPASAEVTFETTGRVVGKPVLSLPVAGLQERAAAAGLLYAASRSGAPGGWTKYPVTYDAATHTVNAILTHFSTWRFWTR
jgi:hypothetical protein